MKSCIIYVNITTEESGRRRVGGRKVQVCRIKMIQQRYGTQDIINLLDMNLYFLFILFCY